MVKATFTSLLQYETIDTYYEDTSPELQTSQKQRAVYSDDDTGSRVILQGTGFAYDGDTVVGGTVNSITFRSEDGGDYATVTGADINAVKLTNRFEEDGVDAMLKLIFRGDDQLNGSSARDVLNGYAGDDTLRGAAGRDWLEGGKGDDQLTGGRGSDTFVFHKGDGQDMVTDFDSQGGGNNQDYIAVDSMDDFTIRRSGSDTIIDFDNGNTLTLVDVQRSTVSQADFHVI